MNVRRWMTAAGSIFVLAACQDAMTDTNAREERPEQASVALDTGYVMRDGSPMRVVYEVRGGRAVFEGDIDLGPAREIAPTAEELRRRAGEGARLGVVTSNGNLRWTVGIVPYVIEGDVPTPSRITSALSHIEGNVLEVHFVPRTTHTSWLIFRRTTDPDICGSSPLGRQGGGQVVLIHDNCGTGTAIHEVLHSLGIWHEQSRCDRDSYVSILWSNIKSGYSSQFDKHCSGATDLHAYDEGSIMHYPTTAFGKVVNGVAQQTIQSLRGLDGLMGQRTGLSTQDVNTINSMYPLQPPHFTSISFPGGTPTFSWTARPGATSYSLWFLRDEEHFDANDNPMPYHTEILVGTTTGTSMADPAQAWGGQSYCFLTGTSRTWGSVIAQTTYMVQAHFSNSPTASSLPVAVDVCQGPPAT